jgi:hypothetical protein
MNQAFISIDEKLRHWNRCSSQTIYQWLELNEIEHTKG